MRTVVTAVLRQTARQRFGSHSLVSAGPAPVTRRRQIREQAALEPIHTPGRPGQAKPRRHSGVDLAAAWAGVSPRAPGEPRSVLTNDFDFPSETSSHLIWRGSLPGARTRS